MPVPTGQQAAARKGRAHDGAEPDNKSARLEKEPTPTVMDVAEDELMTPPAVLELEDANAEL